MLRQPSSRGSRIGAIARSLWWGGLILVHVPVLLSIGRSVLDRPATAEVLTWSVLCLTVFFFVLKLLDVSFLRFRARPGTVLGFVLACALVHHEVVISDAGQALIKQTPAALMTGLVVEQVLRAHRRFRGVWRRMVAAPARCPVVVCAYGMLLAEPRRLPQWGLRSSLCVPRAPPV